MLEIMPEPSCEHFGIAREAPADLVDRQEIDLRDLVRVRLRLRPERTEIDVDELVLIHAVIERRFVTGEKSERQVGGHSELFTHPPARRRDRALARPRVTAAGIRP